MSIFNQTEINARIDKADVARPEQTIVAEDIEQYLNDTDMREAFLSLSGLPGSGKSHLAKKVYDYYEKNSSVFCAYVDMSDCADEIDVYHRIAIARGQKLSGVFGNKKQKEALKQFSIVYDWIYGEKQKTVNKTDSGRIGDIIEFAISSVGKGLYGREFDKDGISVAWECTFEALNIIMEAVPYVRFMKSSIEVIAKTHENQYIAKLLREVLEAVREKNKREELFRTLLVRSIKDDSQENQKIIIILDNFQLKQGNDLGRDQSWLSREGHLMDSVDAFWLIVSRMSTSELFSPVIQKIEWVFPEIILYGFTERQARDYLKETCPKSDKKSGLTDEIYNNVIEKMLEVCKTDDIYLPYILRMVAKHFGDLESDPLHTSLMPEDFVKFTGPFSREELFDYYFYKDMSDLMINAFQILSCSAVWDDFWIELVREQFDNHLLHARNLLEHSTQIEIIGDEKDHGFKLHEAVKDGLFRSRQNYIKKDVLRYFYDVFRATYTDDMTEEQKECWYKESRLQTIAELVYAYLEETGVKIETVSDMFDKIYNDNKDRGKVSESFIRFYGLYLDKIQKETDIPFLNHQDLNLSDLKKCTEEIDNLVFNWACQEDNWQFIHRYLPYCYKYADLYTNCNQPDKALELEKLYLHFCNELLHKMKIRSIEGKPILECTYWKIKTQNAIAYDSSQEHIYEDAYKYGQEGLEELKSFGRILLEQLVTDDKFTIDEYEFGIGLLSPDLMTEFEISDGIEIDRGLFDRLTEFYCRLLDESFMQNTSGYLYSNLMVDLQQKLRGNFPWYQIQAKEYQEPNIDEVWKYGARTYWMRKAILQAVKKVKRDKDSSFRLEMVHRNMLLAYHNVCVYLYKTGYVERACALEGEVIRQSEQICRRNILDQKRKERYESLKKRVEEYKKNNGTRSLGDISVILWSREMIDESSAKDFFELSENISEQMQYLGDYYLHLKWYAVAQKQFEKVLLVRSVHYGLGDSKTLDTMIRLYITAFEQGDDEVIEVLKEIVENQENILLPSTIKAKGVSAKEGQLRRVAEIAENTEQKEKQLEKMLMVVDEYKYYEK